MVSSQAVSSVFAPAIDVRKAHSRGDHWIAAAMRAGSLALYTVDSRRGLLRVPDLNLVVPCPAAAELPAAQTLMDANSASRVDRSIEVVALLCVDPLEPTG